MINTPEMSSEEITCRNCEGACCRQWTMIQLTPVEYEFMDESGATLCEYDPTSFGAMLLGGPEAAEFARRAPPGKKTYVLIFDCSHLVEDEGWAKCDIYDDPRRPGACGNLAVGEELCKEAIRAWQVLREVRVDITPKPNQTD